MPARAKKTGDEKAAWVVEEVRPEEATPVMETQKIEPEVVSAPTLMPQTLDIESKSGTPANMVIVFTILISFVVGVVVGIAGLKLKSRISADRMILPTPTPEVVAVMTPTPVLPKREEIKVAILNGSGKTGAASRLADELKKLGYVIQRTGNATEDLDGPTEVHARETNVDMGKLVLSDLKDSHEVNEQVLEAYDNSEATVVVVIGSK